MASNATVAGLIDIHHHPMFSFWTTALKEFGVVDAGGVPFPKWDPQSDLAQMDRHGIEAAMLSISAPGVYFGDAKAAQLLARECNDSLAELVGQVEFCSAPTLLTRLSSLSPNQCAASGHMARSAMRNFGA